MSRPKRGRETAHQENLLRKRIEVLQRVNTQLENPASLASQTVTAYSDLVDDLLLDMAVEVHREAATGQIDVQDTQTDVNMFPAWIPSAEKGKPAKLDAFGQNVSQAGNEQVACALCGRSIAASRFAPHLESCLGGGRNCARAGRRKTGSEAIT
ncbi:hypothetical protein WJX73_008206 [Symbiochloris irregularis]|uniref:SAGA-associated factor 11 n=1 Tax=Symbiochloris irregularis TaxID=706552 RepID=A0AAW1NYE0_9CHLO